MTSSIIDNSRFTFQKKDKDKLGELDVTGWSSTDTLVNFGDAAAVRCCWTSGCQSRVIGFQSVDLQDAYGRIPPSLAALWILLSTFSCWEASSIPFSIYISLAGRPRGRSSCTATFQSLSLFFFPRDVVLIQQGSLSRRTKTTYVPWLIIWLSLYYLSTQITLSSWNS